MTDDQSQSLERQLLARLRLVSARIDMLNAEREMLERLLKENNKTNKARYLAVRKNSGKKIRLQSHIVHLLERAHTPLRARRIFEELLKTDPRLNASTFRSHMKRLTETGVIEQAGLRGQYRIRRT